MGQEPQEYAPQYSRRERIRFVIVGVVCSSIFYGVCQWWAFPQWNAFAQTAHCRTVLGFSGSSVVLYVLFVGIPLAAAISLGAIIGPSALRSIRARQHPPPGKKVFGNVRIRTGWRAIASAAEGLASIAAFVAIALWGSQQPRQILEQAQLRSNATCSAVRSEPAKAIASLDGEAMRKGTLSAGLAR